MGFPEKGVNWSDEVAVFSKKCGGYRLKINDADHQPPHCHVNVGGRNTRVDLVTLKVLEAWDRVVILQ